MPESDRERRAIAPSAIATTRKNHDPQFYRGPQEERRVANQLAPVRLSSGRELFVSVPPVFLVALAAVLAMVGDSVGAASMSTVGLGRNVDAVCSATSPQSGGFYGNPLLSVEGLWTNGTVIFKPGGPGFVTRDGALGIKFGWRRGVPGKVSVTGHRLDGTAGPLRFEGILLQRHDRHRFCDSLPARTGSARGARTDGCHAHPPEETLGVVTNKWRKP
jgi:hypothetical protein